MTTKELAELLGVQHELVRDAAGTVYGRPDGRFRHVECMAIRDCLVTWGRLNG